MPFQYDYNNGHRKPKSSKSELKSYSWVQHIFVFVLSLHNTLLPGWRKNYLTKVGREVSDSWGKYFNTFSKEK